MQRTRIEWTDATWNPVRGCTKVSAGCKNCYAETFAERFRGVRGHPFERGFDLRLVPEKLAEPLRWRKPCRVLVNSMSDLFHEAVDFEYVAAVYGVMLVCPQHKFQVLTKRAERMLDWYTWLRLGDLPAAVEVRSCALAAVRTIEGEFDRFAPAARGELSWPPPNVWLGVSVENAAHLSRIDTLRQTPAALRFVSFEPLLEDLGAINLTGIHWAIVGGESGPRARGCEIAWIRNIVTQCRAAGVPVLVKQDSGPRPGLRGRIPRRLWVKETPSGVR
jgi:protein gp37